MTYGRLAQLVEHLLDVQEVTGSSPVPSTTSPQTFGLGTFFVVGGTGLEQHVPSAAKAIKAPVQRRRPQPAAETGRSCWGSVLIFQSPAKGLQKNQLTQPVALISARFPTRRNVYQERCRQTIRSEDFFRGGGTGREPGQAKAEYHHDGGILPFALHPPILCVSGQSLRMSVRTYAGKRESSDI